MTVLLNLFEQKVLFFVIIADILAPIFRSCLDFIKNDYQIYYLKCNVVCRVLKFVYTILSIFFLYLLSGMPDRRYRIFVILP